MRSRCLPRTAGQPQDLGSLQGGWWDPGPGYLPISKGHWLATLPFGFWSRGPESQPHADHPSFLPCWSFCLKPAIHQVPCKPTADEAQAAAPPPLLPAGLQRPGDGQAHTPTSLGGHTPCPSIPGPPSPTMAAVGTACRGQMPAHPLCPGRQLSWASRSRASALASQAVLPGKSMSSQGSRGPHRWGSPLGAPVVLHSPLGQALTCGGLGAPQVFIPGFLKLLRFQAHHRHILGRALPKLKGHVSTTVAPPRGAVPWPLQGLGFLQASIAFSWGRPGVSSG